MGAHTTGILALLLVFTTVATHARYDILKGILSDYAEHGNIDEFCDDFHSSFKRSCRDDITPEEAKKFTDLVATGNQRSTVAYINTHLLEQDPDLEMTERECLKFEKLARDADATTVLDVITSRLNDRGFDLKADTRQAKRLRGIVSEIRNLDSCNLGAIGAMMGKVSKQKFNVADALGGAKDYASKQYERLKQQAVGGTIDKLEGELKEEEDRIARLLENVQARRQSVKDATKSCVIDGNEAICQALHKMQDILILDKIGVTAAKFAMLTPVLRDPLYSIATMVESTETFSVRGKIRNASLILMFVMEYSFTIMLIATIVFIWFRPEMGGIVSIGLITTGFGIIPALKVARTAASTIVNRGKGIMLAMAVAFATYGIQTYNITPEQAMGIVYVVIVAYFTLTERERSPLQVIALMAPMLLYTSTRNVDFGSLIDRIPSVGEKIFVPKSSYYDAFTSFATSDPQVLPAIALAICVTVFNLCSLCDSFGFSIYRDVSNAKCGKSKVADYKPTKPTMADYVSCTFNMNSIIILGAAAIPGFFSPTTWFWTFSVYAIALILSGLIYLMSYHEDFIREGETAGSAPDKIIDSMQIIIGMAPKNVILPKFQNFIMAAICATTFTMGYKINIATAVVVAAIAGSLLRRNTRMLYNYIGWSCGLVIMFSGSLLHVVVGMVYLFAKVNTKINFNVSSMGIGETARELDIGT